MSVHTDARRGEWPFAPTTIGMEGPACRVRCVTLDDPSHFGGRDKYAPPNEHDRHAPPTSVGPTFRLTMLVQPLG